MEHEDLIHQAKVINPVHGLVAVLFDWAMVFALFYVALRVDHWVVYLVAIVLVARWQHAIFMMMHEAAHFCLHPSKRVNNYVGQFFLAGPAFFSLFAYRDNHSRHHRHPAIGDGHYPIERKKFIIELMEDLFCISYLSFLKFFFTRSNQKHQRKKEKLKKQVETEEKAVPIKTSTMPRWMVIASMIVGNAVIFSFFYWMNKPAYYLLLWPLPMASVLLVFIRIRGVCEHGGFEEGLETQHCTRTIVNPVQCFFIHPHSSNYHIEHHLHPTVPYYNLKRLHRSMQSDAQGSSPNVYSSYLHILGELTYK